MCAQCLVIIQWNIGELHTKVLLIFLYITTLHSALCTMHYLSAPIRVENQWLAAPLYHENGNNIHSKTAVLSMYYTQEAISGMSSIALSLTWYICVVLYRPALLTQESMCLWHYMVISGQY